MAPPSHSTIEEKLALLQANFKSTLPGKVDEIERCWNSVNVEDADKTPLFDCHRMAHTLVGSGGTFGAVVVSTAARELEQAMKLLIEDKMLLTAEYKSIITSLIIKLKEIAENWKPSKIPYLEPIVLDDVKSRKTNLVFLAEDDELTAN